MSAVSAQCGATLSAELDKRVGGMYEHVDMQVGWCGAGGRQARGPWCQGKQLRRGGRRRTVQVACASLQCAVALRQVKIANSDSQLV